MQNPRKRNDKKRKLPKHCKVLQAFESHERVENVEKFCCVFCSELLRENLNDLKFHMAIYHTEFFFLEALVSRQGLCKFKALCNTTLSLETEYEKQSNVKNTSSIFYCPYKCSNVKMISEECLRVHLIEFHKNLLIDKLQSCIDTEWLNSIF